MLSIEVMKFASKLVLSTVVGPMAGPLVEGTEALVDLLMD